MLVFFFSADGTFISTSKRPSRLKSFKEYFQEAQKWKTEIYVAQTEVKNLEATNETLKAQLNTANERVNSLNRTTNEQAAKIRERKFSAAHYFAEFLKMIGYRSEMIIRFAKELKKNRENFSNWDEKFK